MEKEIIIEAIKITAAFIVGFLTKYCIQKLKNRPKITTHGCRISGQDVYTYFHSNNKPSCPACPYLLKGGECKFKPTNQNSKQNTEWDGNGNVKFWSAEDKNKMLEINENKCYLVFWNQKLKK